MLTLVLMRHAKTEHANPGGDKARRLVARGVQEAQEAGKAIASLGINRALVSPATRAQETYAALGLGLDPILVDELYDDGPMAALRLIALVPESVSGLIVVGHAPTIPALVAELSSVSVADRANDAHHFPTASYSVFQFPGPWGTLLDDAPAGLRCHGVTRPPLTG